MDESRAPVVLESFSDVPLDTDRSLNSNFEMPGATARYHFREFFRNFRQGNIYIYRDALIRQWNRKTYFIDIDLAHIGEYDEVLFNNLQSRPDDILPYFESAAKDALQIFLTESSATDKRFNFKGIDFQVTLSSAQFPNSLRNLNADLVNSLIKVPGIIVSSTKSRAKAIEIKYQCTKCSNIFTIESKGPMQAINLPSKCEYSQQNPGQGREDCGTGTLVVLPDNCKYIDQQTLKLQESPEVVPTGEMPRNIMLSVDRYLVDKCSPGTRISVMGISSLLNTSANKKVGASTTPIKIPYIRVVGIQIETDGSGRVGTLYTQTEEEEMERLAKDPEIYDKIARSIAPQISADNTQDVKKALACLLMGGSRKILPDGVRLRGDINVLLMGDPSTAKSQLLKFIERVAPIGVYTSGKGSSAAGLTASVIKDSKGEFYLEGGAMVLADGGVICIDEFDKMRENDRVAIHEAMEQQTISIAKAGITTVLNSRASVLAAANPIFGRYDDTKAINENIDLMSTILSRFDCIFIVRDIRDEIRDRSIARHVLGVHINAGIEGSAHNTPDIDSQTLKKFVGYCRERCAPRLNDEAAAVLRGQYVHIRSKVHESLRDRPGEAQVVPITIRQLEALVRLSESLAKMRLSAEATVNDVEEAIRLFKMSTLSASQSNPMIQAQSGESRDGIKRAEEFLKRRMGLRTTVNAKKVMEEASLQGHSDDSLKRAISAMVMRAELLECNQRKMLKRIK
jgi:DNA replication licensing factor MCM5